MLDNGVAGKHLFKDVPSSLKTSRLTLKHDDSLSFHQDRGHLFNVLSENSISHTPNRTTERVRFRSSTFRSGVFFVLR